MSPLRRFRTHRNPRRTLNTAAALRLLRGHHGQGHRSSAARASSLRPPSTPLHDARHLRGRAAGLLRARRTAEAGAHLELARCRALGPRYWPSTGWYAEQRGPVQRGLRPRPWSAGGRTGVLVGIARCGRRLLRAADVPLPSAPDRHLGDGGRGPFCRRIRGGLATCDRGKNGRSVATAAGSAPCTARPAPLGAPGAFVTGHRHTPARSWR
jgi:hypothetical protein